MLALAWLCRARSMRLAVGCADFPLSFSSVWRGRPSAWDLEARSSHALRDLRERLRENPDHTPPFSWAKRSHPGPRDPTGRGGALDGFASLAKRVKQAIPIEPKTLSPTPRFRDARVSKQSSRWGEPHDLARLRELTGGFRAIPLDGVCRRTTRAVQVTDIPINKRRASPE